MELLRQEFTYLEVISVAGQSIYSGRRVRNPVQASVIDRLPVDIRGDNPVVEPPVQAKTTREEPIFKG